MNAGNSVRSGSASGTVPENPNTLAPPNARALPDREVDELYLSWAEQQLNKSALWREVCRSAYHTRAFLDRIPEVIGFESGESRADVPQLRFGPSYEKLNWRIPRGT